MARKSLVFLAIGLIILMLAPTVNNVYSLSWDSSEGVIDTGVLKVKILGDNPHFKVLVKGANESFDYYFVKFHKLFEFVDSNGDGVYNEGEPILSFTPLIVKSVEEGGLLEPWQISNETVVTENYTEIILYMNNTLPVFRVGSGGEIIGWVNVSFVIHVFDKTVDYGGITVKGRYELKIDIVIGEWPWSENDSKLGLRIYIGSPKIVAEKMRERMEKMKHRRWEERRIEIGEEGSSEAFYFGYVEHAKTSNGRILDVNGSYERNETGLNMPRHGHYGRMVERTLAKIDLIYPHYEGILVHDPIIGLEKGESGFSINNLELVAITTVIGIAIIASIMVIRRRK